MNRKNNVVFFITELNSGGLENYLLRFLQYKYASFDQIYLYCKSGKKGQLDKEFEKMPNIHIIRQVINYVDFKSFKKLELFFQQNNIDCVCDFTGNFAGPILYYARKAGIEKRMVFYRNASNRYKESILRNLYNSFVRGLTLKFATDILANSETAFRFFYPAEWEKDKRFSVIYNGVNKNVFSEEVMSLRSELGIPTEAFVIGHTGRYNTAKNHKTIIEVAKRLLSKYEDMYFILCGNGVQKNLTLPLSGSGFEDRILVFENRRDIPRFLKTMNVYFFPSITEGNPNALIEAMVLGLPIIASDIEPIKETIPDFGHVELRKPLDIEGFVQQLENVYKSKEFSKSLIYRDWAKKKFDFEDRFDEFYNKIIEQ